MILNEITVRKYGRYQAWLEKYTGDDADDVEEGEEEDAEVEPTSSMDYGCAVIMAARESGIATELPEILASGDIFELPLSLETHNTIVTTTNKIYTYIQDALKPATEGES